MIPYPLVLLEDDTVSIVENGGDLLEAAKRVFKSISLDFLCSEAAETEGIEEIKNSLLKEDKFRKFVPLTVEQIYTLPEELALEALEVKEEFNRKVEEMEKEISEEDKNCYLVKKITDASSQTLKEFYKGEGEVLVKEVLKTGEFFGVLVLVTKATLREYGLPLMFGKYPMYESAKLLIESSSVTQTLGSASND